MDNTFFDSLGLIAFATLTCWGALAILTGVLYWRNKGFAIYVINGSKARTLGAGLMFLGLVFVIVINYSTSTYLIDKVVDNILAFAIGIVLAITSNFLSKKILSQSSEKPWLKYLS